MKVVLPDRVKKGLAALATVTMLSAGILAGPSVSNANAMDFRIDIGEGLAQVINKAAEKVGITPKGNLETEIEFRNGKVYLDGRFKNDTINYRVNNNYDRTTINIPGLGTIDLN